MEDINLLRLAGLPFIREVVVSSVAELHLSEQRMVRVLCVPVGHVQQAVVEIPGQGRLCSALQVIRSPVVDFSAASRRARRFTDHRQRPRG